MCAAKMLQVANPMLLPAAAMQATPAENLGTGPSLRPGLHIDVCHDMDYTSFG